MKKKKHKQKKKTLARKQLNMKKCAKCGIMQLLGFRVLNGIIS